MLTMTLAKFLLYKPSYQQLDRFVLISDSGGLQGRW